MTATSEPIRGSNNAPIPAAGTVSETGKPAGTAEDHGRRIISGIDLVDYSVGGLFPEKVYVVKGAGGTGKTILGLQFLLRGLEHGEPGIFITDQKPEKVLAQARSIGFPVDEPVKRGQLTILNTSSRYFELVESPADVMAIIEELGDYVRKMGANRVVIDPVRALVNTTYSGHFALSITQSLVNGLDDIPATTLLIAGDENDAELNPIIRMLEQNAFGVIELAPDAATGGRMMRLSNLRYAASENLGAHYRILDGRGLMNYRGEGETVVDITKPLEPAEANRSVMILGSNPDSIRKVKDALGAEYQVASESDMKKGIERVRNEKPGLVLITPSTSQAAISAVFDLAQNSSSAIAFMSPSGNRSSDRVLYLRAGADDFITEPFTPAELRARVEALIRRSGRRLNTRDAHLSNVSPEEISKMLSPSLDDTGGGGRAKESIVLKDGKSNFSSRLEEKLRRNLDTMQKFNLDYALYWMKIPGDDAEINRDLAKICRQEDVLCHNSKGEFVAILTGTDENGVRGFESRVAEKLGGRVEKARRGYALHQSGEAADETIRRALA